MISGNFTLFQGLLQDLSGPFEGFLTPLSPYNSPKHALDRVRMRGARAEMAADWSKVCLCCSSGGSGGWGLPEEVFARSRRMVDTADTAEGTAYRGWRGLLEAFSKPV